MKRILVVKITSLGDIVQAQPIVSDLRRAYPGVRVDWAADESFAEVLRWNPGIDRVLCAPLRRFKQARSLNDLRTIAASIGELRREHYDLVLDIHGMYKSAITAFLARSRCRYGYRAENLGERGAAFAYTHRFKRCEAANAWHSMRVSVSDALGYALEAVPRFGLHLPPAAVEHARRSSAPRAMFFHATSSAVKKWAVQHWIEVGRALSARGFEIALPWGSEDERAEAVLIAAGIPGAEVLPKLSVTECAQRAALTDLVVGTDTGFVHLAYALEKPTVMIFTATSRSHFGIDLPGRAVSVGDQGRAPDPSEVLQAIDQVYQPGATAAPAAPAAPLPWPAYASAN
jgi:heptosyltransferase-1